MPLTTRITLLKVAAAGLLIIPGLIMILGPESPLIFLVNAFLDFAHQPMDGLQRVDSGAALLQNAILGGILVGFGMMIWLVTERVYRNDPQTGREVILIPLLCWFLTDSAGSIIAGGWFNAVINIAILTTFLVPLLWPQPTSS